MIKIYGHPATSAHRCFWLLEELALEYQVEPLDMRAREHKSPAYLALNPNGKVPTLCDGNLTLFESMAINTYLAEKHRPQLLGRTLEDRALVSQWSFWSLAEYQKPMIELFIQKVFVPENKRDHQLMERSREKVIPLNELLNEHLREHNHMVGSEFTLADLNVASVARLNAMVAIETSSLSHLTQWLERMTKRSAYAKVEELCQAK